MSVRPSPIVPVTPGPLAKTGARIQFNLDLTASGGNNFPPGTLWIHSLIKGQVRIFRRKGLFGDSSVGAWVFTGIDLLSGGGTNLHLPGAVPATYEPNQFNVPIGRPTDQTYKTLHDNDVLITDDGRVWHYTASEMRWHFQGDLTESSKDYRMILLILTRMLIAVESFILPDTIDFAPRERMGNHGDAAFNLLGQWFRNVHEAWVKQDENLWSRNQPVEARRIPSWPIQWIELENVTPPIASESVTMERLGTLQLWKIMSIGDRLIDETLERKDGNCTGNYVVIIERYRLPPRIPYSINAVENCNPILLNPFRPSALSGQL